MLIVVGVAGYGFSAGWFETLAASFVGKPAPATSHIADAINSQLDDVQQTPLPVTPSRPVLPLKAIAPTDAEGIVNECRAVANHLVKVSGGIVDAIEMQARVEFKFGSPDTAKQLWTKILESQPDYVFALSGLGTIAMREGHISDAVTFYRRCVLADAQNPTHRVELATALLSNNELEEARRLLAAVNTSHPDYVEAHVQLGTVLNQLGEFEAAKAAFEQALELESERPSAHFGLATSLLRMNDKEAAATHMARYAELQSEVSAIDRSERRTYDDVKALSVDVAELFTLMSRVYVAIGNTDDAQLLLVRASRMNPNDISSRQALAWLSKQRGRIFDSIRWLRQVAALQPDEFSYALEIARLYVSVDQLDESERVLLEFEKDHPDHKEAVHRLAEFFLDAKHDLDQSLAYARKSVDMQPSSTTYQLLSDVYQERKEMPEAIHALEQAIDLEPDNSVYPQLLAILKNSQSDVPTPAAEGETESRE